MKENIYDTLIERNRKILRIIYPIYFLLILIVVGCVYIKNIVAIIVMGIIFIIFTVLFFKFLIRINKLNNRQLDYNIEIGKDKYKDLYK